MMGARLLTFKQKENQFFSRFATPKPYWLAFVTTIKCPQQVEMIQKYNTNFESPYYKWSTGEVLKMSRSEYHK